MGRFLDAVEQKIESLTRSVEALGEEKFNERTRLEVHDLLCTLRLAIWEDEAGFVEWLDGKTHEINGEILQRIILKAGEKDAQGNSRDGVELRFHIFKDGSETFKHNHRQDFITIPLTGMYEYTWWMEDKTQSGEYFVWERAKGGALTLKGKEDGVLLPAKRGSGLSLEPLAQGHTSGKFQGGDEPMFVHHEWLHTIKHIKDHDDDFMVTFVVRRGYRHLLTRVVSEENDAEDGNVEVRSTKNGQLSEKDKRGIQQYVADALRPPGLQTSLTGSGSKRSGGRKDSFTHLQNYITPTVNLLRVNKSDFEEEENLNQKACAALMKSNGFTFLPLMEDDACSEFLSIDVFNPDDTKIISPPQLASNHHALSAILWTIGSREFVCPVWDESQTRFEGIFALDNVKGNTFRDALLLSLVSPEALTYINDEQHRKNISGERVAYANQLVDTLTELDDFVFSSKQTHLDKTALDALIHRAMLNLGPLINMTANVDLPQVSREKTSAQEGTLIDWARFPMFVLKVDDPNQPADRRRAERALELIYRGANYSQLALMSDNNDVLLTIEQNGKENPTFTTSKLTLLDPDLSLGKMLSVFSKSTRPLFVRNEEGDYGIFSIYEFKQKEVFPIFQNYVHDFIEKLSSDQARSSMLKDFGVLCHALFSEESEDTEEAFRLFCLRLQKNE